MDFTFSEDQIAIRDSVERIFTDLCHDDAIKALAKQGAGMHHALWQQLAETGILGLAIAEAHGGMSLSLVDLCLIIEQQGRSVAPIPLISSVVESAMTIADSDNHSLVSELLPKCVSGEMIFSPARPYAGIQDVEQLTVIANESGWIVNGRSGFVPYAASADGFLVQVNSQAGSEVECLLVFCSAKQAGLSVTEQTSISDEPAGYIVFNNAEISSAQLIARGQQAELLIAKQRQRTWIALAAMQLGALDEGLKRTAEYVSERKQFGRALGSFQAVSQQAADAYMEIESLRSVYWRALDDIQNGHDIAISAAVTKYWVAEAGHKAAHTVLHLHGGIGQDLDYPIHRYFLFAKQCERYLGSANTVAAELGKTIMNADTQLLEDLCQ